MSLSENLKEMGFDDRIIKKAIRKSKADTLEQAIEWICQNQDRSDLSSDEETTATSSQPSDLSLVEPSQPIKQKTPEELEAEKKRVEDLIKQRKNQRMEEERRDEIQRELLRRKTGTEIVEIRERVQNEERLRAAQEIKRERAEREIQRQKILEEIKRDREKMKRAQEPAKPMEAPKPIANLLQPSGNDGEHCRLAIRLPDGNSLIHQFKSNEQLCAVRLFIRLNRKDLPGEDEGRDSRFNIHFPPCKTFTDEEMNYTLRDLGLCPSARLTITDLKY